MEKPEFDALFDTRVREHLGPLGFRLVGKTVAFRDAEITVSLVRLGGRLSTPGAIAQVLCFRHSFLRCLHDESVPSDIPMEVFDYPFKFASSELVGYAGSLWRYVPRNLNYPHDTYAWHERQEQEVASWLDALLHLIGVQFLPWARALGPAAVAAQLRQYGEDAWCERLWLEDYQRVVGAVQQ